jgi:hypothetical protein
MLLRLFPAVASAWFLFTSFDTQMLSRTAEIFEVCSKDFSPKEKAKALTTNEKLL